ncbi:protein serine/threonine kinase [Gracilaria domingensis]|nr:protein serine/threonine kinase [Gracilaria domingensis]
MLFASVHRGVESQHWIEDLILAGRTDCPPGSGVSASGSCEICQPGTFGISIGPCDPCYAGSFANETGQASCTPCPPGTLSRSGATFCIYCPDGQLPLSDGSCGLCPPGEYHDLQFGAKCTKCLAGFFKPEAGNSPCLPCPLHSFSLFGAANCTKCEENQTLMRDGTCASCPPGQFMSESEQQCEDCNPGRFTDFPNAMSYCFPCGGNSFSKRGSTECVSCPKRQVYIQSSERCEVCPPGTSYNSETLECDECSYNQFSRGHGERYCTRCAPNSFARRGATTCFACEPGTVFIADIDACGTCGDGVQYNSFEASCRDFYSYRYSFGTPTPEPSPFLEELE